MLNPRELLTLVLIGVSTFGIEGNNEGSPTEDCNVSLDLTGVGLKSLPNGFVKNEYVTRLTLDNNLISELPFKAFSFVPSLTYLSFANNNLTILDLRFFSELPNLKTLVLNENCKPRAKPRPDPRVTWNHYHKYRPDYRTVENEYENYCSLQFDSDLLNLEHLFVNNNNLQTLTFSSGELPMLTHFYLSHNPLKLNEAAMIGLNKLAPALTHLYLRHCDIPEFDVSLLPTVKSLYFDNNRVRSICNEYCEDASLKLKGAEKLETLSVSHNLISKIETDSFNYTTNLLTLDLSHNQIVEIREGTFDKLLQLRSLSLQYNNYAKLSSVHTFRGLTKLENLYLGGNDLSNLTSGLFANLSALKKLMLNSAKISSIDSKTFSQLPRLEVLSLAGNQLSIIPDGSMPVSGSLIYLNLDRNRFTSTKDMSLSNAPKMLSLSLKQNPLTTVHARWVSNLSENLTIILEHTCSPELGILSVFTTTTEWSTTTTELEEILDSEYDEYYKST